MKMKLRIEKMFDRISLNNAVRRYGHSIWHYPFREQIVPRFYLPLHKYMSPKGFVRIRHHGILACRVKKQNLKIIRGLLNAPDVGEKTKLSVREVVILAMSIGPFLCKSCKSGTMVVFETIIPKSRGQPTGNKVPA